MFVSFSKVVTIIKAIAIFSWSCNVRVLILQNDWLIGTNRTCLFDWLVFHMPNKLLKIEKMTSKKRDKVHRCFPFYFQHFFPFNQSSAIFRFWGKLMNIDEFSWVFWYLPLHYLLLSTLYVIPVMTLVRGRSSNSGFAQLAHLIHLALLTLRAQGYWAYDQSKSK